ncbi:MAG: hypothetical protein HY049_13905 [Acidobacteria bacterium]|nr:hypothetical protein [Acidobacteriota bacterium]
MIRFLRAFVWLRWRLVVNGLRGGKRRDLVEDISRAAGVAVPLIVLSFFAVGAASFSWLSFHGGRLLGTGEAAATAVLLPARLILFLLLFIFFLIPLARSMHGSTLGVARFLLLPIPRSALHAVEVAATLFDPWVIAVAPGLVAFPLGLAVSGSPGPAGVALVAVAAFLVLCASLGALLSFLFAWLLRDRRRAEIVSLLFMLAVLSAAVVPALVVPRDLGKRPGPGDERGPGISLEEIDARLPVWTAALPSEMCVRAVRAGAEGDTGRGMLWTLGLTAEAAVLFVLSGSIHRRLLDSGGAGGTRRGDRGRDAREFRIPGLGAGASAVAVAHVRTSLRTLIGRLAVLGMAPMILALGTLAARLGGDARAAGLLAPGGYVIAAGGMVFSLLTLQPILMNQLGSDRAGLTLQFIQPLGDREIVLGKAAGGLALFGACAVLSLAAGLVLNRSGAPLSWLAALLAGISTYLWTAPVSALLSAIFPKASNLGSFGPDGKAHGASQFFGALATLGAAAPPMLVLVFRSSAPERATSGFTLILAWTLLAAFSAVPLLGAAARLLGPRRENIGLVASGR